MLRTGINCIIRHKPLAGMPKHRPLPFVTIPGHIIHTSAQRMWAVMPLFILQLSEIFTMGTTNKVFPVFYVICFHSQNNGGERGIRTLERALTLYSLSRRAPSAYSAISPLKNCTGPLHVSQLQPDLNNGGGSRIRTHGTSRYNGFQDRRLQPLGHPS